MTAILLSKDLTPTERLVVKINTSQKPKASYGIIVQIERKEGLKKPYKAIQTYPVDSFDAAIDFFESDSLIQMLQENGWPDDLKI